MLFAFKSQIMSHFLPFSAVQLLAFCITGFLSFGIVSVHQKHPGQSVIGVEVLFGELYFGSFL